MSTDELDRMKERIARTYAESPGGDLDGLLADIRDVLARSASFSDITTHKTGSRTHLIEARCRRASSSIGEQHIAAELLRAWRENLCYDDFESHAVEVTDTTVILDFITGSDAARLYVTGMIVVDLT